MPVKHPTDVQPEPPEPPTGDDPQPNPEPDAQPNPEPDAQPDPEPAPAKIRPKRYTVGQRVTTPLYGTIDSTGRITPTAGGGTTDLEPGSRGNIIAMPGDELTASQVRILNG